MCFLPRFQFCFLKIKMCCLVLAIVICSRLSFVSILFAFSASANFISLFFPMLSASWHMFVFTRTIICVLYNKSQVSHCTHQRPFQMTLLLMYLLCCSLLQNPLYYLRNNDITLKDVFKIRVLSKHNLLSVEFLFNVSSITFPPSSPILLLSSLSQ